MLGPERISEPHLLSGEASGAILRTCMQRFQLGSAKPISYKRPDSVTRIGDLSDVRLDELLDLSGRIAVVTGGARGIGRACCTRLAEAGATVVVADLDDAGAAETAAALGPPPSARTSTSADGASVAALAGAVQAEHGRLDIWVERRRHLPHRAAARALRRRLGRRARHEPPRHVRGCARGGARHGCRRTRRRDRERLVDGGVPRGRARRRALRRLEVRRPRADEGARRGARAARDPRARGRAHRDADARLDEQREALRSFGFALDELGPTLPLGRVAVPDDVARVVLFCASGLAQLMTGSTLLVDAGELV